MQLDPSLRTRCANLAAFLEARHQISKKAAATRGLNRKATAAGEPAYHGGVGKARKKADEKAAAAAAKAATTNSATPPAGGASPAAAPVAPPVPTTPHA